MARKEDEKVSKIVDSCTMSHHETREERIFWKNKLSKGMQNSNKRLSYIRDPLNR